VWLELSRSGEHAFQISNLLPRRTPTAPIRHKLRQLHSTLVLLHFASHALQAGRPTACFGRLDSVLGVVGCSSAWPARRGTQLDRDLQDAVIQYDLFKLRQFRGDLKSSQLAWTEMMGLQLQAKGSGLLSNRYDAEGDSR
jgi:hypothetical protein